MLTNQRAVGRPIVAAATPAIGRSPLNRGKPIIQMGDDTFLRVGMWWGPGWSESTPPEAEADGQGLTRREYDALVGAQHFTVLPSPVPAQAKAEVWVIRPHHPRAAKAVRQAETLGPVLTGQDGTRFVVAVDGRDLLCRWKADAMYHAHSHAKVGQWALAETEANLALACGVDMDHEVIGFLCVAYERLHRVIRADGMLMMALRSRGPEFEEKVIFARDAFRDMFAR